MPNQDSAGRPDLDSLRAALHSTNPTPAELPELLYHYTSAEGFLGILASDAMWASHSRYLNDPSELVYASQLMGEAIEARLASCTPRAGEILRSTQAALARLGENDFIFAASFSEVGDLLSQWRGYGQFGGGYAVGVRPRDLDLPGSLQGVALRRVEYDRDRQVAQVERTLDLFCENGAGAEADARLQPNREGQAGVKADVQALYARLAVQAVFFKHFSFSEEREWRAVAVVDQQGMPEEVKFRPTGGVIVPYITLDMRARSGPNLGRIPLGRIVCGPTLQAELSLRAVAMALREYGHNGCEVKLSKVPLRRHELWP
jgi:hypothetical protein